MSCVCYRWSGEPAGDIHGSADQSESGGVDGLLRELLHESRRVQLCHGYRFVNTEYFPMFQVSSFYFVGQRPI